MTKKKHHGSSFESFLDEDGILEEVNLAATQEGDRGADRCRDEEEGPDQDGDGREDGDDARPTRSPARSGQRQRDAGTLKRAAKTLGKSLRLELA